MSRFPCVVGAGEDRTCRRGTAGCGFEHKEDGSVYSTPDGELTAQQIAEALNRASSFADTALVALTEDGEVCLTTPARGSRPVLSANGTVVGYTVPRRIAYALNALYPPDPAPNLTALSLAVADVIYDLAEVYATAYRFWRTDPDVIAAVEEIADYRAGDRVSHGRLGRAYVLAWRNDYLGLRSRWVMRAYRAEGGLP